MPRKQKTQPASEPKQSKKTLLNTIVKNVNNKDEHIIMQLSLSNSQIEKITNIENNNEIGSEPIPYERGCCYINDDYNNISSSQYKNELFDNREHTSEHKNHCCFWCCHGIEYKIFGMPLSYDSINDTYTLYGSFCSLQCANAYNFASHTGSDKVWEVNSMIQLLGKIHGIQNFIRPAPSKYLLKMFNGPLEINDFRKLHNNTLTTHVLNLPPMIAISSSHEVVNTSYLHS
jgi:hypothetical protein